MTPILECRDLSKSYEKGLRPALNHVNLKLQRGRIIGLLGPNGSGKTTLIKLANGLLTTKSGELLIGGSPVGLETLAATINEEAVTLEDVYEPYLMQIGFLTRTPRGRCVTAKAYQHLGLAVPGGMMDQLSF